MPAPIDRPINRRELLTSGAAGLGTLTLGACDGAAERSRLNRVFEGTENLTRWVQRHLPPHRTLAREYAESDLSPHFKANGSTSPDDPVYRRLAEGGFADWRLEIGGLVERPARLSLDELRALPARTQITRHDCVEGWSCIGKWTGAPLSALLDRVGVKAGARYVVFHCADTLDGPDRYYESIAFDDAYHPQTILAYAMNGQALPIAHGAPLRLRVERQLGYKMAKYVMAIALVDSFAEIGGGRGGFWEDRGYEWYAGI